MFGQGSRRTAGIAIAAAIAVAAAGCTASSPSGGGGAAGGAGNAEKANLTYWYWGESYVGWCPTGYYTHFYGNRYGGFRHGVYGWAGGD